MWLFLHENKCKNFGKHTISELPKVSGCGGGQWKIRGIYPKQPVLWVRDATEQHYKKLRAHASHHSIQEDGELTTTCAMQQDPAPVSETKTKVAEIHKRKQYPPKPLKTLCK